MLSPFLDDAVVQVINGGILNHRGKKRVGISIFRSLSFSRIWNWVILKEAQNSAGIDLHFDKYQFHSLGSYL